jgi:hypothetical protein
MRMKLSAFATLLAGAALLASCNKKENSDNANPNASNITAGQCTISFNTDKDFNGTTSINIPAGITTYAVKSPSGSIDQLSLTANKVDIVGASAKTQIAMLTIHVPTGSTTSGGSITGSFDDDNIDAVLLISNLTAPNATPAYASESGTITITKLTATELEGSFSANCINEEEGTSIKVSNGKFAAKFK